MDPMIIFDDGLGQLGPMTDLRAAFEVRTGAFTTAARLAAHRPKMLGGYWVPDRLRGVVGERANAPVNVLPSAEILLLVNGRWAIPDSALQPELGHAIVEASSGHVVAARLRLADAEYFLSTGQLHERVQPVTIEKRMLYKHPWDVVAFAHQTIAHDILSYRVLDAQVPEESAVIVGEYPVEIHKSVLVYPNVIFDAERGPILVQANAVIRPGAIICGPCAIGTGTTIMDQAILKPHTAFGPGCKIGGEVGATIFQGYSNKAHDGHLGDSWVGKWINIGAGTTNSNLMNTYGEVSMRVEPDGPRQRTGLTFLGTIMGDHSKFAINTRLMTGTVIGTGAMIATTAPPPTTVRRFAWLTDEGERVFRYERFVEMMDAMMRRRRKQASETYRSTLRELYERLSSDAGAAAPLERLD
ncbi:MAG: putative sugar nucleotidyl transferase [Planctomycetota bacterium]|jgi:UDP-N-acetylglucosamine diphosphorylase/glucosamine-1-phosphate N-acetyltransferase